MQCATTDQGFIFERCLLGLRGGENKYCRPVVFINSSPSALSLLYRR